MARGGKAKQYEVDAEFRFGDIPHMLRVIVGLIFRPRTVYAVPLTFDEHDLRRIG